MTEVLKALQELNVCWKKIGHYNMKCRWLPGHQLHSNHNFVDESTIIENNAPAPQSVNVVKFELQVLYIISSLYFQPCFFIISDVTSMV